MATKGKKRTPIRWAQNWGKETLGIAGKMLTIMLVTVALGLLFSAIQAIEAGWIRLTVAGAVALFILLFYFGDGLSKGVMDTGSSRQYAKMLKDGKTPGAKEDAACYHPLKALCGALILISIPLAAAIFVALNAKEYTYTLQDLPTWLSSSYAYREDVLGPLSAYTQQAGASMLDWVRVFARLFVLPYVNLFSDPQRMIYTVDLCVPLFMLTYPLTYTLGYLRGPAEYAKQEKLNKKAKKVAVRKQQKSKLVQELLGETNVPHYGHKRDSDKPKKKELI